MALVSTMIFFQFDIITANFVMNCGAIVNEEAELKEPGRMMANWESGSDSRG